MSRFSEDKNGIPPDPTQKTLSNFILSRDASGGKTSDYRPLVSEVCDNSFSVDENCCPTYCADTSCDLRDSSMENQTSDSTYSCHILGNINEDINETDVLQSSESRPKVMFFSVLRAKVHMTNKWFMIQTLSFLIVYMSFFSGS